MGYKETLLQPIMIGNRKCNNRFLFQTFNLILFILKESCIKAKAWVSLLLER